MTTESQQTTESRLITNSEYNEREERTIRQLLAEKNMRRVVARLNKLHPADIAEFFEYFDEQHRKMIFSAIDDDLATKIIQTMDENLQFEITRVLGKERLVAILDALPSDETADILARFPSQKLEELLNAMEASEASDARELLRYEEDSAGGIMSVDIVYFDEDMDVATCIDTIREHREDLETLSYLYVTDETKRLTGVVTIKDIVLAGKGTVLRDIMTREPLIAARLDNDQEEVAKLVAKYSLLAIPIVNEHEHLVGIVHVDDIIDVIHEETTEDMYRMVGLDDVVEGEAGPILQTLSRTRWLVATFVGSMCAGTIIRFLKPGDAHLATALSAFIPAIMGLGGGVAIQTATVLIRGLATGDVEHSDWKDLFKTEWKVACLLGIIIGSLLFVASFLLEGAWMVSLIVGGTMLFQCVVAMCLGLFIPLTLKSVGIDPAVAAGPLTQMSCDISGMLIFYGAAHLFLYVLGATSVVAQ